MPNKYIQKILKNPNLITFCNKIVSYNNILENDTLRNIFLESLISSDCLIDINSCNETIEVSNFILNNINLFVLEDSIKQYIIEHCNDAINIAKTNKENIINK